MPNRKPLSQSLLLNLWAEKKIVFWGLIVNALLVVSKLAGGLLFSLLALIADGIHSLSDMVTDLILLWGLKMASRPADTNHHYGHGKLETLASLIVAIIFLWTAISPQFYFVTAIYSPSTQPYFARLRASTIDVKPSLLRMMTFSILTGFPAALKNLQ